MSDWVSDDEIVEATPCAEWGRKPAGWDPVGGWCPDCEHPWVMHVDDACLACAILRGPQVLKAVGKRRAQRLKVKKLNRPVDG